MPIRSARRDDCDKLPDIERAAAQRFRAIGLDAIAGGEPSDPAFIRACLAHGVVLVATDAADRPVGFALAGELDRSLHLYELDVLPEHGRQGLGAGLIRAVIAEAATRGLVGVTLSTFADVPWNAPFYARLGFRPLDAVDWTPALHLVRNTEAALGLPMERRIVMRTAAR